MFKDLKRSLGHDIYFREGRPMFQLNLSDIDPKYNNIIVLDDLMDLAVDSQIISKLFTQGRHGNASVILQACQISGFRPEIIGFFIALTALRL